MYVFFYLQALAYSRDYKQKYEYFRSKLRKPVSTRKPHIYSANRSQF